MLSHDEGRHGHEGRHGCYRMVVAFTTTVYLCNQFLSPLKL